MPSFNDGKKWKRVPFAKKYWVSEYGDLYSEITGKHSKTNYSCQGYLSFGLTSKYRRYSISAHRLVATCFLTKKPGCNYVCHKDGNPKNNHYSNLYWGTPQENADDRRRHKRTGVRQYVSLSTKNARKAPIPFDAADIEFIKITSASVSELAAFYKMAPEAIQLIRGQP